MYDYNRYNVRNLWHANLVSIEPFMLLMVWPWTYSALLYTVIYCFLFYLVSVMIKSLVPNENIIVYLLLIKYLFNLQQIPVCTVIYYRSIQNGGEDTQYYRHTVSAGLLWTNTVHTVWTYQNLGRVSMIVFTYFHRSDYLIY